MLEKTRKINFYGCVLCIIILYSISISTTICKINTLSAELLLVIALV